MNMPSEETGLRTDALASSKRTFSEVNAFLQSGAPWPDQPPPECNETHASMVYLTHDRAWKLKKPVRLMHVDQVSLDARKRLCRKEVRLNRALSGDIYRGITPIVRRVDGALALGGAGRIVDWLIESVRLPDSEMLDRRLVNGPAPDHAEIEALCTMLVGFFQRQPQLTEAGNDFYCSLLRDTEIATKHLRELATDTDVIVPEYISDFAVSTLKTCRREIIKRGRGGLIVEGHGDLRAEHVCLTTPPVVFDNLEIDQGNRALDPFYEITALGLECGLLGSAWIHAALLNGLSQSIAPPSRTLLTAYGIVALLTRARFAADHFRDDHVATPMEWRVKTKKSITEAARLLSSVGEI
jgi:aminoglycoside phosphotransferase family enzyme